jgi:hypothetical protein
MEDAENSPIKDALLKGQQAKKYLEDISTYRLAMIATTFRDPDTYTNPHVAVTQAIELVNAVHRRTSPEGDAQPRTE